MRDAAPFSDRLLDFRFEGRRITMPAMIEAIGRLVAILRDVDARTTEREGGTLDWVLRDLEFGSAAFVVEAQPQGEHTPVWAPPVVISRFYDGMRRLVETGERPEYFGELTVRRAYELTSLLDPNGIEAVKFGRNGSGLTLTPSQRKPVKDALEGRHRALGSIEGTIESLSAHELPYSCTIYTRLSGEPVRCYFGPELLPDIYGSFRKPVMVRGTFSTRANGEITSIRITEIEPFPDPSSLPTVDDIIGILTNGD